MFFLTFSNASMQFVKRKLIWRLYILNKTLLTTKRVQIIDQKEFAAAILDPSKKSFIVYIVFLSLGSKISIHPTQKAQIAFLLAEKIIVSDKYLDFANVFSKKIIIEFLKYSAINKYLIDLELGKQPPYSPIYSLEPVELEILKTFIKINLVNSFIQPFKSLAKTLILFV